MQDRSRGKAWLPAFAGMSGNEVASRGRLKGPHLRHSRALPPLFPAKAGTQTSMQAQSHGKAWVPAFAGMSGNGAASRGQLKGPHLRSSRVPHLRSFPRRREPDFPCRLNPREGLGARLRGHERKRSRLTRSIERPPPPLFPASSTSALSRESGNPDFPCKPDPTGRPGARLRGHERKRSRLTPKSGYVARPRHPVRA